MHAIGKAAELSGVKVTTIRYYEENGLMPPPLRTDSGRRVYDNEAVDRLRFIRHARDLGFPVETIRGLIELQHNPGADCAEADRMASAHLGEVRNRIRQLRALERELIRMIDACQGGVIARCQVLACLGDHSHCESEHAART